MTLWGAALAGLVAAGWLLVGYERKDGPLIESGLIAGALALALLVGWIFFDVLGAR